MTKPHHNIAHKVLTVLAGRAQPGPNIAHPDAWRREVRNDLRSRHWQTLEAVLGPDDQARASALADLLEPPSAAATGTTDDSTAMRQALEAQMAENARLLEEALATPRDPDLAKARLSEIRDDLGPAHTRSPDETADHTHWRRFEDLIRGRADCDIDQALDQLEEILDPQPESCTP